MMVTVTVLWQSKGTDTVAQLCVALDVDSTMHVQNKPSSKITWLQIHCTALNLNRYSVFLEHDFKTSWRKS